MDKGNREWEGEGCDGMYSKHTLPPGYRNIDDKKKMVNRDMVVFCDICLSMSLVRESERKLHVTSSSEYIVTL